MTGHRFEIVQRGPEGTPSEPMKTADSESDLHAWLRFNGACLNKPGSSIFETEDGVVYEIRIRGKHEL